MADKKSVDPGRKNASSDLAEADLIKRAADGENESYSVLAKRYEPLIASLVSRIKTNGGFSRDDLIQEAHIAFLSAVRSYKSENGGVTFGLYAKICIRNKLISCLRRSKKKAYLPENGFSDEKRPAGKELTKEFFEKYGELLSAYERAALTGYLENKSYKEIASSLGKSEKSVDNALLRARNKIRKAEKTRSTPGKNGRDI